MTDDAKYEGLEGAADKEAQRPEARVDPLTAEIQHLRNGLQKIADLDASSSTEDTRLDSFDRGYSLGLAKAAAMANECLKPRDYSRGQS